MDPVILLLLGSITTDWVWLLIFMRFLDHTQRRTTVGRTPLNEWSVRRRDLYLTTHNNHNRQTSMPPTCWGFLINLKNPTASAGFEPANLGTKGQHATSRPPKPLIHKYKEWIFSKIKVFKDMRTFGSGIYQSTKFYIPGGSYLYRERCENIKSRTINIFIS